MSTHANLKVTDDSGDELWFYRHSDGYPEGAMPLIDEFMNWVRINRICDNASQAAGWLILLGAKEYGHYYDHGRRRKKKDLCSPNDSDMGWKCGAIEPTTGPHEDIAWLYILDLREKLVRIINMRDGSKTVKRY